jgi:hypothetical protein
MIVKEGLSDGRNQQKWVVGKGEGSGGENYQRTLFICKPQI